MTDWQKRNYQYTDSERVRKNIIANCRYAIKHKNISEKQKRNFIFTILRLRKKPIKYITVA